MSTHRILVVDGGPHLVDAVRLAMDEQYPCEVVQLVQDGQLREVVDGDGPWDAIVAGPTQGTQPALRRLADVCEARPDVGLLVTVDGPEPADLHRFDPTRPDELVRLPVAIGALRAAIAGTIRAAHSRRSRVWSTATRGPRGHRAMMYAVSGPTGGSGKTTLAINLAYLLSERGAGRVVLVDLDLQFGEVAPALRLRPTQTIHHVVFDEFGRPHDTDHAAEALPMSLYEAPGGFSVLPAPRDPAWDAIRPEHLTMLFEVLQTQADIVVLDTPAGLGETTLTALDHADHAVAVTQIDLPGVTSLQSFLRTLDQLGYNPNDRTVVLNKELEGTGLSGADLIEVIAPVGGSVPFDPDVTRALNSGLPVCAAEPDAEVTLAIVNALTPMLPAAHPTWRARKGGWLRRDRCNVPRDSERRTPARRSRTG
ncbi:MAG: AAA family ATPase [Egibacteraceae bacterium]